MNRIGLIFLISNVFFTAHATFDTNSVEEIVFFLTEPVIAQGVENVLSETINTKIPYIGNKNFSRIIAGSVSRIMETLSYCKDQRTIPNKQRSGVFFKNGCISIALKACAVLITEGIIQQTKYLLHKGLECIPALQQQLREFNDHHPTLTNVVMGLAEQTYRANIKNVFGNGIDELICGYRIKSAIPGQQANAEVIGPLQRFVQGIKEARFTLILFSYRYEQ